jgi:hypothetical protein
MHCPELANPITWRQTLIRKSAAARGFNWSTQHADDCICSRSVADDVHRLPIQYMDSQQAVMWGRWPNGESLQQFAVQFDRNQLRRTD